MPKRNELEVKKLLADFRKSEKGQPYRRTVRAEEGSQ